MKPKHNLSVSISGFIQATSQEEVYRKLGKYFLSKAKESKNQITPKSYESVLDYEDIKIFPVHIEKRQEEHHPV